MEQRHKIFEPPIDFKVSWNGWACLQKSLIKSVPKADDAYERHPWCLVLSRRQTGRHVARSVGNHEARWNAANFGWGAEEVENITHGLKALLAVCQAKASNATVVLTAIARETT